MKKSQIQIARPIIGRDVRRAVGKVLRSGNLTQGQEVNAFEREFSQLVNERECVAVNSGTSALHIALLTLGIGMGDEVIVPSFTFAATANSVALTGATPVFIDIDIKTYNLDPNLIKNAITPRTKAIQVVHLYGLPADMPRIVEIARQYNLYIIEDAAQAHNASINGQPVGTFGAAAAFSFYPTKNMTSGEGGMIVFKDKSLARTARLYRNQGMEKRYQNEIVGFNLRMTDIHAAIGRAQLKHLRKWNKKRQDNALILSNEIQNVVKPFIPRGFSHVFHQYTIRIPKNRDGFSDKLSKQGIENSVYYPIQVHRLPSFNSLITLPQTQLATESVLSIPVHPSLSKSDLKRISYTVNLLSKDFDV
jgi:dTDP-4-amino-4,6-dideoxygalactose transaminase